MRRYTDRCEDAIRDNQSQKMVDNTSQIARLGNRVIMAAKNEADNSEEPSFVQRVNEAASSLHSGKYIVLLLFNFDRERPLRTISCLINSKKKCSSFISFILT